MALDTETTSLDAMSCDLVGVSLALGPDRACYIPLGHLAPGAQDLFGGAGLAPGQIPLAAAVERLKPLLEDAATLGAALRAHGGDLEAALARYERSRVTRTARVVLMTREMGRIYHARGVERLVRNDLWKGRTPERYYDALEWLYGWRVERCLADA